MNSPKSLGDCAAEDSDLVFCCLINDAEGGGGSIGIAGPSKFNVNTLASGKKEYVEHKLADSKVSGCGRSRLGKACYIGDIKHYTLYHQKYDTNPNILTPPIVILIVCPSFKL